MDLLVVLECYPTQRLEQRCKELVRMTNLNLSDQR